jgi:glutamate carboxypeptidase
MDAREAARTVLERSSAVLGRAVVARARGGASDAAHFAAGIPVTIDGLGPRGGAAHNPEEYVLAASLATRAQVALAVTDAVLDGG